MIFALNVTKLPTKFWQTMLKCSFCAFLILLQMYLSKLQSPNAPVDTETASTIEIVKLHKAKS